MEITSDLEFNVEVIQCLLIFLDDATSITSGTHFTWKNQLQITCFPQEYDNTNIDINYNNVRNEGHSA